MTEIERVRRFEKMNESSLYKSIKGHDGLNIIYIISRIEYSDSYIIIKYEYLIFLKIQTTFALFPLVRFLIHYLQRISWLRK